MPDKILENIDPDKINGVFSTEKMAKIGSGTTAKRTRQTVYYFVSENDDGTVSLQGLSPEDIPSGPKVEMTREELLADYMPEPEFFQKRVVPKIKDLKKSLARGDKYRKRGESFTAEFEYNKALELDESNVRANFGIGLCFIERGEKERANEVFKKVVAIDAAFGNEHKHLFNEFGIQLRKNKMYDQALQYYGRALELVQNDENIHYNLARAHYEKGDKVETVSHLTRCLDMNPEHKEAKDFLEFLKKKKLV